MKKYLFILALFSNCVYSQIDTFSLQKVRFELGIPFDFGMTLGNVTKSGILPEGADILMNNNKKYGFNIQVFTPQIILFNKCIVEFAYTMDNLLCDRKSANEEFLVSNNNYFIQTEPKYGSNSYGPTGNYAIHYFRYGLAWNFKWSKSRYLQPYAFYTNGKGEFPESSFAFKENNSNIFFINKYSFKSIRSSGYVLGFRFRKYLDAQSGEKPARMYAYVGIKLEFAYMQVKGNGEILRTDPITEMTSTKYFDVAKQYTYTTLGVYMGIGMKKYKDIEAKNSW